MSVNTSEEYLDELLDAIEPIIRMGEPEVPKMPEISEVSQITETPVVSDVSEVPAFEPEPEFVPKEAEIVEEIESGNETIDDEGASAISDLLSSLASEEDDIIDENAMSEEDIESMLNAVSNQNVPEETAVSYDEDVKELLKQFTEDEDLTDIQDILDKNDNGEALDNSMLDLPDVEVFQLEEDSEDAEDESDKAKKANPITKLIGGFSGLFKKRKSKKNKEEEGEQVQEEGSIVYEETEGVAEQHFVSEEQELDFADVDSADFEELLGEDVDDFIFDEDMSDIEQLLSGGAFAEEDNSLEEISTIEETEASAKSKKSKKKERKEKVKRDKNKKEKPKKESIFTKVLNALTEELDEPTKAGSNVPEAGETVVTEENLNILEELSAEDKKKAKLAKKEEKQKKKAEKKNKKAPNKGENDGEDDGKDSDEKQSKKSKKPKKKREKKEKPRKVEEITKPEKKLPKKRVMSTFALCFSILAAILILQNVVFKSDNLKEAKYAFDNGDYATCFANLESVERDEEEEDLYQKSMIILSVQRKWDAYNNFVAMNNNLEALNSLLEGVAVYRNQEETALELGVHAQIAVIYQKMLEALQGYGVSQSDVDEILGYESKVTYTKRLDSIINGTPFVLEEESESTVISEPQPLQDVLPGEEDFLPDDTTLVNEEPIVEILEEDSEGQEAPSSGETVVVGSDPINISQQDDSISYEEPIIMGGQNVGSGNTNMSMEVTGQNVVVGVR